MMPLPRLYRAVCHAIEARGGMVRIDSGGENRVIWDDSLDPPKHVVEAQGIPNLLHEYLHVVQRGRLEIDHGMKPQEIPYDIEAPRHRELLWEEFAACVVSCAYGESSDADDWFAEQVGILGYFFGHWESPETFFEVIDNVVVQDSEDIERVLEQAYRLVREELKIGANSQWQFLDLWSRFRGERFSVELAPR